MMPRLHIEKGQQFFDLTALYENGALGNGKIVWHCQCICGKKTDVTASSLHLGKKKSCGCRKPRVTGSLRRTHGMTRRPTYVSWQNMWTRCTNPNYKQFADYGGRGVTICDRWRSFENFLADMGLRQEGMSLDRIDPFGNYEPKNCRWATRSQQNRNTRGHAAIAKMQQEKDRQP